MINKILKVVCEQLAGLVKENRVPVRRFSHCQAPRWLPLLRLLMWGIGSRGDIVDERMLDLMTCHYSSLGLVMSFF